MGGLLLEQPRATDGQCCTAVTKPRAALNGHQTVGRTQWPPNRGAHTVHRRSRSRRRSRDHAIAYAHSSSLAVV